MRTLKECLEGPGVCHECGEGFFLTLRNDSLPGLNWSTRQLDVEVVLQVNVSGGDGAPKGGGFGGEVPWMRHRILKDLRQHALVSHAGRGR